MPIDPDPLFALMARLCCIGLLLQTTEVLWNAGELREGRLFGWSATPPTRWRWPGFLYAYPLCRWLLVTRAALALLGLGADFGGAGGTWLLGGLVILQLYYNRRFRMLAGNCETLFLICLVAVWVGSLPGASSRLKTGAMAFVAIHVGIAYAAAGVNKLRSWSWRSGARLLQVVSAGSYSMPRLAAVLQSHRDFALVLTWGVILLEVAFPLAVFLPTPVFWVILISGVSFHAGLAFAMGLHGFWWAFLAAYPSVWFIHGMMPTWIR